MAGLLEQTAVIFIEKSIFIRFFFYKKLVSINQRIEGEWNKTTNNMQVYQYGFIFGIKLF